MRYRAAIAAFAVTLGCASASGLHAQTSADLDRIEAAIESGALTGLRAALENWIAGADEADPEQQGRAGFLRARLMTDVDSAHAEYLMVALDGRSSYGALAWLRLAQLELAQGEPARALENLERLRADYPSSVHTPSAWYWTGRALESGGELEPACHAFDEALAAASASGDDGIGGQATERRGGCSAGGLRFTLQIGAFSGAPAAESLASTARALGFPVRIIREDGLEKVRVGRFASPDSARLLERRLRADGFSVAIVAAES
ncbi:MAG: SPOR domain-containing protein [Gemmatimonadota bacterium]|nr:SPOR domain-containing protein [Gemmatimonadota bacterium]